MLDAWMWTRAQQDETCHRVRIKESTRWIEGYSRLAELRAKLLPTLNEVMRMVAMLSRFLGRKEDGESGIKTIWQGLQQIAAFVHGFHWAKKNQAL